MTAALRLWGRANSYNVQKVLWLLAELGLDFDHVPAGGSFGRLTEMQAKGLNPHGRVPALEDGDVAVWESHAILRYVAARYGRPVFWSDDPADRARVEPWMDWALGALQPAFLTGLFWGYYRTPEQDRDWPAIRRSIAECDKVFGLLDRELAERPYLAGDELSLADIAAGVALYRYYNIEVERPSLPHVEAWRDRLEERPAYRATVMTPFDELRGRLSF